MSLLLGICSPDYLTYLLLELASKLALTFSDGHGIRYDCPVG